MKITSFRAAIILFSAILAFIPLRGISQNTASEQDDSEKVIRSVRFVGNDNVKNNTLEALIRTQTNREFLGIPRFTPWYFLWQLSPKLGESPSLLNRQTVATDIERIQRYYQTIGYLEATVDTNIVEFKKNRVEVSFLIEEGPAFAIQTVAYSGMPEFENEHIVPGFYLESDLTRDPIDDTTYTVNRQYSEEMLGVERNRIITFLKDNGHAAVQRDSVNVLVKRNQDDNYNLDVLFTVEPGRKYTFGDLYIKLSGPDNTVNYDESDTLRGGEYTTGGKTIYLQKEKEAQSKFSLLSEQVLFKPGNTFNNSLYVRTINEFQNLGMLSIRQFGLSEDGSQPDFTRDSIPVMFSLQTLPKHSINLNFYGLKRYGFGSGAGFTYTNNNLFGSAENLQLSLNGSFEYVRSETIHDIASDSSNQSFNSQFFRSFESRVDYSLPRLIFPFAALDDRLYFSNARTRYSLSFSRSNQLLFDINSDIRFNLRYEVQHNERFSSFLDLIELDLLDTDPTEPFEQSLREEFGEDSFEYRRIREDFRPQVSSILRYTLRSRRTDLIKRDYGYFSEYTLAMGGNFPYLVDRYLVTPGILEGNLPPVFPTSQNSLAYSRFVKGTADFRRYIPISGEAVFAYRGFMGLALPYGESNSIPLNQRFYAGGSNDIRGWDIYSLGPGSIPLDEVTINGGEIKLLAQTEVRQNIIRNFLSADWIGAWFTDAGNIWYGPRTEFPARTVDGDPIPPTQRQQVIDEGKFQFDRFYKQIAVGSGLGLRIDWDYVIVRFDFAFRLHDLQEGWFENKKMYFGFGIGHSF